MKRFLILMTLSFCILTLCGMMPQSAALERSTITTVTGSNSSFIATGSNTTNSPDTNTGSNNGSDSSQPGNAGSQTPIFVVYDFFKQLFPHWKKTILLGPEDTIDISQLPQKIQYMSNDGALPLSIDWQISDEKLREPGLHYITGSPILPDDVVFAEGFDGITHWPVFRSGDGAELPVTPEEPEIYDSLIGLGGDPETELDIYAPADQYYVGEDGYVNAVATPVWHWDYSKVDVHTPGCYRISGTSSFPDGYTLADGYTKKLPVFVLPSDRIELFAATEISGRGSRLYLSWIYKNPNPKTSVLEYQTEDENWEVCDSSWYSCASTDLALYLWTMPKDIPLTIRLRYQDVINGEIVERITDPVVVTIPDNIQELYDELGLDSSAISELVNGDRDGSDSSGAELPDIEQPMPDVGPGIGPDAKPDSAPGAEPGADSDATPDSAPEDKTDLPPDETPESKPDSEPATPQPDDSVSKQDKESASFPNERSDTAPALETQPVYEIVTDSYTAITGLRLKHLISSGPTVLFEKQGVSVEIPSVLLDNLRLGNSELFEITIQHPQQNVFQISVLAAGLPLDHMTGTLVSIPWNPEEDLAWECLDSDGTVLSEAIYRKEHHLLCVTIDRPGLYFLAERTELPTAEPQATPVPESACDPVTVYDSESAFTTDTDDVTVAAAPISSLDPEQSDTVISSVLRIVIFIALLVSGVLILLRRWRNHDKT